jgi:predicted unusual protein kinase regulating ubiquinone biosynthesis (AarF/ABC1/UbiB family)
MFDIFNDDSLDAMTMQELAFGVMASMRDFPFKLPQEAIYILRASAIIEGLGTVYVENFNGIKDILPILQRNIPRALGADTGLFELAKNEFDSLPLRVKQLSNAIQKASEDELRVHISERQLEWLESRFEKRRRRERLALLPIMLSILLLLLDADEYRVAATLIFTTGAFMMLL